MHQILEGLNPEQKTGVKTVEGPVLILAGAGSGKTKVLTHRIAYLIQDLDVRPDQILAVTFTNKAAGEMRTRVGHILGDKLFMPYLGTFHAVCAKILRQHIQHIGYSSNFVIFDENDRKKTLKELLAKNNFDAKHFTPEAVAATISSAKNELVNEIEYSDYANSYFQEIVAQIYPQYQAFLKSNNALDFDDLLIKTIELFRSNKQVLNHFQNKFQYILIDEYQDTNKVQYQIVKTLAQKHRNLCVVGDDWQSIYSWRGADFKNILDFERDYPDTTVIKLEQNYRSTKNILSAAQKLIENNHQRSDKELWTENPDGSKISHYLAYNEKDEAEFVANRIMDHVSEKSSFKFSDFAVFYRTNSQSRNIEDAFLRFGLRYQIVGGVKFYDRLEIRDIIGYLRVIYNPMDLISLGRVINVPARGIGDKSQSEILDNWSSIFSGNFTEIKIGHNAKKSLAEFIELIKYLQSLSEKISLAELIDQVVHKTRYREYLIEKFPTKKESGISEGEAKLENIQELKSVAQKYGEGTAFGQLSTFLEEVALTSDMDKWESTDAGVTLMTVHNAKGLEFPVVFMIGMEENLFPHSRSLLENSELEEERRLCYVAMTRAREKLYMVNTSSRLIYGSVSSNTPSRFLAEIPEDYIERFNRQSHYQNQTSNYADNLSRGARYSPGQKILHEQFGEGIVVSFANNIITAVFPGNGIKKLDPDFAPVKKMSHE